MTIDAMTALSLAAVILSSTQGPSTLATQLPLEIVDRREAWLVRGTAYTDKAKGLRYCVFHVFIRKDDAEVTGIGLSGRQILSPDDERYWSRLMTKEQYERVFGPPTVFEPEGIRDIYYAAYGGIINKPSDAIDYANALLRSTVAVTNNRLTNMQAVERDKTWHITADIRRGQKAVEVVRFSRETGRVLTIPR